MSSLKRRGQAWIVFESIEKSRKAMDELQSHLAFGKKIRISFSRNISDITRNRTGLPAREKTHKATLNESNEVQSKRIRTETRPDDFFNTEVTAPKSSSSLTYNPPNRTLVVEHLPDSVSQASVEALFRPFPGFVEARLIPGRGLAFVEFIDEHKSQTALSKLANHEIENGHFILISNAKR